MRPDLVIASHGRQENRYWVVQDPVTLNFFRLRDEECFLLRALDGRASLEEIRRHFERQFAPLKLGALQLQAFLYRLHSFGLVIGDVPGQGDVLEQRTSAARRRGVLSWLANPLAIRLPGVAAGPMVAALYPFVRWTFSPLAVVAWLLLVLSALALVTFEFTTFQSRLPDFWTFFNVETATWFAVALVGIKILHELGHALVCRHFGGACREIGVLLLFGMPTLYCDVSDAWRLESKWQRMLVSAAGMLVELVLAAIATCLWWFSEPGILNAICLRIMFLCSVSTLVFNINPLLRYDGYYLLSDYVEIPNLWQESRALWRRSIWNWFSREETPPDPTIPRRQYPALMAYAVLSSAYGLFVIAAILWFCWKVLEPQGLATMFGFVATPVLLSMAVPPIRSAWSFWSMPTRRTRIRRGRVVLAFMAVGILMAALILVPVPFRIRVPAWIEPKDAKPIYVSVPGRLEAAVSAATNVTAGQTIAKLFSRDIEARLAQLSSEVSLESLRLKNLQLLRADDPSVAPLIPAAEKALEDAQHRLDEARREQDRLVLRAPIDGSILPPPLLPPKPTDSKSLSTWHGTPLDEPNRGCYVTTGTLVCQVGDPARVEAMFLIEQSAIAFVRRGQTVRLRIDQGPVQVVTGKIIELAKTDASVLPERLARTLDLPMRGTGQTQRQAATYYQARVALDSHAAPLRVGMHGHAKILADWQPLGRRLWRSLQLTFRL